MLSKSYIIWAAQLYALVSCGSPRAGGYAEVWSNSTLRTPTETQTRSHPTELIVPPTPIVSLLPSHNATVEQIPNATIPSQPSLTTTTSALNSSCGRCTINVRNAALSWWLEPTYTFPVYFSTIWKNDSESSIWVTPLPATTTIDAADAMRNQEAFAYNSDDFPYLYTLTPSAASTAIVTRTATRPINGSIDVNDVYKTYITEPEPASTIVAASPTALIVTSATPFVVFSDYEIIRPSHTAAGELLQSCPPMITQTSRLPNLYAFTYSGEVTEDDVHMDGDIPGTFLQQIGEYDCTPGRWTGDVTVIFVVDISYKLVADGIGADTSHLELTVEAGWGIEVQPPATTEDAGMASAGATQSLSPSPTTKVIFVPGKFPIFVGHKEESVNAGDWGSQPTNTASADTVNSNPTSPTNDVVGDKTQLVIDGEIAFGEVISGIPVVVIGSQTITPAGSAATIGGTVVSLAQAASEIVIAGVTSQLILGTADAAGLSPAPTAAPVLSIGGSTIVGNAATQYYFGPDQTLTAGGQVVWAGTTISLDQSAAYVVVGGSTSSFAASAVTSLAASVNIAGQTITQQPNGGFVVDQQTLLPGSQIVVSGTTLSLAPSASFIVVDGHTSLLTNAAVMTSGLPLTIDGDVYTARPGSGTTYMIGGQALTPGGQITVAGHTISLLQSSSAYVVDGTTTTFASALSYTTNAPLLTIHGQTVTAVDGTTYVYKGQTLTPGGLIVIDGETISLSPSATQLVVDAETETLFPATTVSGAARSQSNTRIAAQTGDTVQPGDAAQTGGAANPNKTGGSSRFYVPVAHLFGAALVTLVGSSLLL